MRRTKQHSIASYLFWIGMATISGVTISSSVATAAKIAYRQLSDPDDVAMSEIKFVPPKIISETREKIPNERGPIKQPAPLTSNGKEFHYGLINPLKEMSLSAESYLVADADTGDIIMEKNRKISLPIASITKLMTAVIAMETIDQNEIAVVPEKIAKDENNYKNGSMEGEIVSAGNLLYPLLLSSSNAAAETLASMVGRKKFLNKMNQRASSLKLNDTKFEDPSGVSSDNVSTAEDMAKFISHLFKKKKNVLDITKQKKVSVGQREWLNNDKLINLDSFLGGKTGYTTAAQKTFVGIFAAPLMKNKNRNIAIVLLKSNDREDDALKILEYLQNNIYLEIKS